MAFCLHKMSNLNKGRKKTPQYKIMTTVGETYPDKACQDTKTSIALQYPVCITVCYGARAFYFSQGLTDKTPRMFYCKNSMVSGCTYEM